MKEYSFVYKDKNYLINIEKDSRLKTRARFEYRDGIPYFRIPMHLSYFHAKFMLKQNLSSVVSFLERTKAEDEHHIFIFGKIYDITYDGNSFNVDSILKYQNKKDRTKKLKKMLYNYASKRMREYEMIMNIDRPYNLMIREMKTRYGTNSKKTHRITLSLNLIHYSFEMIDSVIIHELAHDKYFDHSKNFYNEVLKYCPNYRILNKRMKKGEYA